MQSTRLAIEASSCRIGEPHPEDACSFAVRLGVDVKETGGPLLGCRNSRIRCVPVPNSLPQDAVLMMNWIRHLRQKWDDWCGDRDMEISIRNHLSRNGYFGRTAKFQAVRLVAVQRPGWLQVYRFEVNARVDARTPTDDSPDANDERVEGTDRGQPEYRTLFGLVREDHRHNRSDVRVFQCESERKEVFERWSDGLVCLRGAKGLVSS